MHEIYYTVMYIFKSGLILEMNSRHALTFIVILCLSISCSVLSNRLQQEDNLRKSIAESILIPFEGIDTIVFRTDFGLCGNSDKKDIRKFYDPRLYDPFYLQIIKRRYNEIILFTESEFYQFMDSICLEKKDLVSEMECHETDKLKVEIHGYSESRTTLLLTELYQLNDTAIFIRKRFKFEKDKWRWVKY